MGNVIGNIRNEPAAPDPGPTWVERNVAPYAKAILAFVAPGAIILWNSVLPGSDGGATITQAEWVMAGVSMVVTGAGVWAVPNKAKPPYSTHRGDNADGVGGRTEA